MLRKILSYGSLAILSVTVQLVFIIYAVTVGSKIPAVGFFYLLISIISILYITSSSMSCIYKFGWITLILSFPFYGGLFYILFNRNHSIKAIHKKMLPFLSDEIKRIESIHIQNPLQHYLYKTAGFPLLKSPESHYYSDGEQLFEAILQKIREAEKCIYIEFFIIADGYAWKRLEKILAYKIKNGVDVRIIFDGGGCLFVKPKGFKKELSRLGIKYREFNPISLRITGRVNYRNHRKIIICDNKYAFCCGINISDEYMNYKNRFGKWKDTGIMVSGASAESFSAMFCGMWNYLSSKKEISFTYSSVYEQSGDLVQPFSETPLDNESVSLKTYLSLITSAKTSVYITTPYLICDDEMINALTLTAKKGIETIIILPGIPDKRFVYALTRSYYRTLIEAGVKIYEFSPGFIHSKTIVIDNETAICGTINFDCRSMYLLFECACIFYDGSVPSDIYRDFLNTVEISKLITKDELPKENVIVRIVRGFLRLFAPLL